MRSPRGKAALLAVVVCFALIAVLAAPGGAQPPPTDRTFNYPFESPVLGMNAIPGRNQVMVADTGAGIVRVSRHGGRIVTPLPGVSDVLPITGNRMFAITGGGGPEDDEPPPDTELQQPQAAASVFYVWGRGQKVTPIADLRAAEEQMNPDGELIDSNPFGMTRMGRNLLVADAGANAVWRVHIRSGRVAPLAAFPPRIVETAWLKAAISCPGADLPPDFPADLAELCGLPDEMPAESVPTSVAIGPDGFIYVGELTGFPGGPGNSRIWRVDPSARNVDCATSDLCEVVFDGFTSIVDLEFTSRGRLVVAEIDRATFLAMEEGQGVGGAISVCVLGRNRCRDVATGLEMLTSIAVASNDRLYASVFGLVPGAADVTVVGDL